MQEELEENLSEKYLKAKVYYRSVVIKFCREFLWMCWRKIFVKNSLIFQLSMQALLNQWSNMTLEKSSMSEINEKEGIKITKKRTVKTFIPRGSQSTSTPWGVTLKPVPRKSVTEETVVKKSEKNVSKTETKATPPKPESKRPKVHNKVKDMFSPF